jgi:hypothetical protein
MSIPGGKIETVPNERRGSGVGISVCKEGRYGTLLKTSQAWDLRPEKLSRNR